MRESWQLKLIGFTLPVFCTFALLIALPMPLIKHEVMAQTAPNKPGRKQITIPFEIQQGHIYVDAFVNERGPYRFMVDTGASGDGRADIRLVKELELPTTGTTTNSDGVNTATVPTVEFDSLRVGTFMRRKLEVLARDYNARAATGTKFRMGIIGRDFFSEHLLTIDYVRNEITISKGSLDGSERNTMRYETAFVVPLRVGLFEAVGSLDSGSNLEMHLPMAWAKRLGLQDLKEAGEGRRANTVFKLFSTDSAIPVEIARNKTALQKARFSELVDRINIGGAFLVANRCVMTLDQRNRLVRLRCANK